MWKASPRGLAMSRVCIWVCVQQSSQMMVASVLTYCWLLMAPRGSFWVMECVYSGSHHGPPCSAHTTMLFHRTQHASPSACANAPSWRVAGCLTLHVTPLLCVWASVPKQVRGLAMNAAERRLQMPPEPICLLAAWQPSESLRSVEDPQWGRLHDMLRQCTVPRKDGAP